MSRNSRLYRGLTVLALVSAFLFASLPAQALPTRRPVPRVAVTGDGMFAWIRSVLVRLGIPGMAKEGVSIDPDGIVVSDEGVMIDPNG